MSLDKRSIELGTEGWGVKEDNLLAFRKDRTRYVEKPFTFSRASEGTIVNSDGYIQYSGVGDELVTNGGFDDGLNNWSVFGGNYASVVNGILNSNNTDNGSWFAEYIGQDVAFVSGKTYKITFLARNISGSSNLRLTQNANVIFTDNITNEFTNYTVYYVANANNGSVRIFCNDSVGQFEIDNISIKQVEQETPRISYDIVDGVVSDKPHLLLEPARTNLITYSEDFGGYTNSNSTDTPNDTTSPDGVSNGTSFKEQATTGQHKLATISTFDGSSTYTFSIFAKYNGRDLFIDTQNSNEWGGRAWFDLSLGTANAILGSASIEDYGDGWYRCIVTGDSSLSGSNNVELLTSDGSTNSTTGDTTKGVYIYGAQLELGSYATSYIPNFGNSNGVTRAAETANNCGAAQDFNDDEGVLFIEMAALSNNEDFREISINDGTINNRILVDFRNENYPGNIRAFMRTSDGGGDVNINYTPGNAIEFNRVAFKYKSQNYSLYVNGEEVDSSTLVNTPNNLKELSFHNGGGIYPFYGKVKELKVYTETLNDAELRLLTKYAPKDYDAAFTADYVDNLAEFTVLRTEATDKLYYSISDGTNSVSGSATITATQVTISNIDISSLNDGTLTLSVYIEDERKQRGVTVTDTTIKDTTNTPLYSYALQQRATGATFEDLDNSESIIESLNVEV